MTYTLTATNTCTSTPTNTFTLTPTPTSNVTLAKQVSETSAQSGDPLVYTLIVNVSGNQATGMTVTDLLPNNLTYVGPEPSQPAGLPAPVYNSATSQLTWVMPSPLGAGTYILSYEAKVNEFLPGGTTLTNRAVMTCGAGGPVTASVSVAVTGQYTVKVGVYNEAGELVKEILVHQYSQPIDNIVLEASNNITTLHGTGSGVTIVSDGYVIGTWDGTNANGDPVVNGEYHIQVDNVDRLGVVKSVTQQVMVNRKLMKETVLIYNEAGEVVRHLYAYADDPGAETVVGATLSSNVIEPTYGDVGGVPRELTLVLSDGVTIMWDGKNDGGSFVGNGQYIVEVHSVDGEGGETTLTEKVSVIGGDETKGVGVVKAEPNELTMANGVGQTTFKCETGLSLTLNARIYTVAGELAGTVEGVAGTNEAVWDARGKASGIYLAVVDLLNSDGGRVGRQIVESAGGALKAVDRIIHRGIPFYLMDPLQKKLKKYFWPGRNTIS